MKNVVLCFSKKKREQKNPVVEEVEKLGVLVHFTPHANFVYLSNKSFSSNAMSSAIHMTNENED